MMTEQQSTTHNSFTSATTQDSHWVDCACSSGKSVSTSHISDVQHNEHI